MSGKTGPIVITLKKRDRASRLSDPLGADDDEKDARGSASRSRSSGQSAERSPKASRRSPSPLKGRPDSSRRRSASGSPVQRKAVGTGTVSVKASSPRLNKTGLEDIFARFHGEFDTWLKSEGSKLERAESCGTSARDALTHSGGIVRDYLQEHAPGTLDDLGTDPVGEMFASRALPRFLDSLEEDRKVLTDAASLLGTFAARRFPNDSDLDPLKADSSPLPLLRSLLRKMAEAQPTGQPAAVGTAQSRGRRRRRERSLEEQVQPMAAASSPPPPVSAAVLSAPLPPALDDDGFSDVSDGRSQQRQKKGDHSRSRARSSPSQRR